MLTNKENALAVKLVDTKNLKNFVFQFIIKNKFKNEKNTILFLY